MMKRFLSVVCCLLVAWVAGAQPATDFGKRHQVRIGWGDAFFENYAFAKTTPHIYPTPEALPENFSIHERYKTACTGHLFAEYGYRFTKLVRVGAQVDAEGIFWQEGDFDRHHQLIGTGKWVRNFNIVVMPTVRLEYLHKHIVTLYSGAGAGVLFALDNAGGFELAPALNLNLVGVQLGCGHWSGSVDLGLMSALSGGNKIYMLCSRLLSFSLNYAW